MFRILLCLLLLLLLLLLAGSPPHQMSPMSVTGLMGLDVIGGWEAITRLLTCCHTSLEVGEEK